MTLISRLVHPHPGNPREGQNPKGRQTHWRGSTFYSGSCKEIEQTKKA